MNNYPKVLLHLLLVGVFNLCNFQRAESAELDDLTWDVVDGEVTITACHLNATGFLAVPETIGGFPVTSVGEGAFANCYNLTIISLPESVTKIGSSAFRFCYDLVSVNIPDAVTSIADDTFLGCLSLTSIVIPASVNSISASAFTDCFALSWFLVSFENSHYQDLDGVLFTADGSDLVRFPPAKTVTSYQLPNTVTCVCALSFLVCKNLEEVILPVGLEKIERGAFTSCESLERIVIPGGVTEIGERAFGFCENLSELELNSGLETIGEFAFYECNELTSVSFPDTLKDLPGSAFASCRSFSFVEIDPENPFLTVRSGAVFTSDLTTLIFILPFRTFITIPEETTNLGPYSFSDSRVTSLMIPAGLTEIGSFAFRGSHLESIVIPDSMTSIEDFAFSSSQLLESVSLPSNLTSIGRSAFSSTALSHISIPESVTSIGVGAFSNSKIESLTIPAGILEVADSLVSNCESLVAVVLPDSLQRIGSFSFRNCHSLTSLTLPDNVTEIGEHAFERCRTLESFIVPEGVSILSSGVFSGCSGLVDVVLPATLQSIDSSTFQNCPSLTHLYFNGSAPQLVGQDTSNWGSPFNDEGLKVRIWSDEYLSFGKKGDYWNGLEIRYREPELDSMFWEREGEDLVIVDLESGYEGLLEIPANVEGSSIVGILDFAFSSATGLTTVNLSPNMVSLSPRAFHGSSLQNLYVDSENPNFESVAGILYNKSRSRLLHYPPGREELSFQIPSPVSTIGSYAFGTSVFLEEVIIPESVVSIGEAAFAYCPVLSQVSLPASLQSLGDAVFAFCPSLEEFDVAAGNLQFRTHNGVLFNSDLSEVILYPSGKQGSFFAIPAGVEVVHDFAFFSSFHLRGVDIPASVTSVGSWAFSGVQMTSLKFEGPAPASYESNSFRPFELEMLLLTKPQHQASFDAVGLSWHGLSVRSHIPAVQSVRFVAPSTFVIEFSPGGPGYRVMASNEPNFVDAEQAELTLTPLIASDRQFEISTTEEKRFFRIVEARVD